jgi:hypothetical protein
MPENACQHFYTCTSCGTMLRPRQSDCCVFCSYSDQLCPPKQQSAERGWETRALVAERASSHSPSAGSSTPALVDRKLLRRLRRDANPSNF